MRLFTKKTKSGKGFSLSELLMALVIVSVMTVALTAGVSASLRVYRDSVRHSEERTLLSTLSEAIISELRNARDIEGTGTAFTYTSAKFGPEVCISVNSDGKIVVGHPSSTGSEPPSTSESEPSSSGNESKPLVGNGAYSNNTIKIDHVSTKISRADENDLFTVKLVIAGSGETREFTVRPIVETESSE